jgi:hypothetical protein
MPSFPPSHGIPGGPHLTTTIEGHHNEVTGGEELATQLLDDKDEVIYSKPVGHLHGLISVPAIPCSHPQELRWVAALFRGQVATDSGYW